MRACHSVSARPRGERKVMEALTLAESAARLQASHTPPRQAGGSQRDHAFRARTQILLLQPVEMKVVPSETAVLKLTTEGDWSFSDILTFVNAEFRDNIYLIRKG